MKHSRFLTDVMSSSGGKKPIFFPLQFIWPGLSHSPHFSSKMARSSVPIYPLTQNTLGKRGSTYAMVLVDSKCNGFVAVFSLGKVLTDSDVMGDAFCKRMGLSCCLLSKDTTNKRMFHIKQVDGKTRTLFSTERRFLNVATLLGPLTYPLSRPTKLWHSRAHCRCY